MRGNKKASTTESFSTETDGIAYLSSKSIFNALTHMLYLALRPLAHQTDVTLDIMFQLIGSTSDQRRRLTILNSDECLNYTYRLLFEEPDVALRATLSVLGTERTVYHYFITNYLNHTYQPQQWASLNTEEPHFQHQQLLQYTEEMYGLYCDFRSRAAQRFIKLAFFEASKNHWMRLQSGLNSDLADTQQNYFLAALRGIDKFYPGSGTLAGYMKPWLTNASGSQYTMYTGEAFQLSRPVRKMVHDGVLSVNNKSADLETALEIPDYASMYSTEEESTLVHHLRHVHEKPEVCLILVLNSVPWFPSKEDIELARKQANLSSDWKPPTIELDDMPIIETLSRSSRRDTASVRRRKEVINARGRNGD
jgi:hypothetical protein